MYNQKKINLKIMDYLLEVAIMCFLLAIAAYYCKKEEDGRKKN